MLETRSFDWMQFCRHCCSTLKCWLVSLLQLCKSRVSVEFLSQDCLQNYIKFIWSSAGWSWPERVMCRPPTIRASTAGLLCVHLCNSWCPVQWGGSEKAGCQHSRQTRSYCLEKTDTRGYRGVSPLPMAWVEGKLGISFPGCRVRSRSIVGQAPLCAKTHIIRSDHLIWSSDLTGLSLLWKPGALLWLHVI